MGWRRRTTRSWWRSWLRSSSAPARSTDLRAMYARFVSVAHLQVCRNMRKRLPAKLVLTRTKQRSRLTHIRFYHGNLLLAACASRPARSHAVDTTWKVSRFEQIAGTQNRIIELAFVKGKVPNQKENPNDIQKIVCGCFGDALRVRPDSSGGARPIHHDYNDTESAARTDAKHHNHHFAGRTCEPDHSAHPHHDQIQASPQEGQSANGHDIHHKHSSAADAY
jgi:hypothetical protein